MILIDYINDHSTEIIDWAQTTLWLAALPLVIGVLIAFPFGWLASRYKWTYPPLVSGAGILYTIPSLVLFLVLPGILGTGILDAINVAVALTIYTFALLVRIIADGLSSVSQDALSAASAMGYTARQKFFGVQLPISVPVIGAGVRVASVSNVSLISVASVIGTSQLGQLFTEGFNNGSLVPVVLGLIFFIVLALLFDLLILLGIRLLTPWRRAVAS